MAEKRVIRAASRRRAFLFVTDIPAKVFFWDSYRSDVRCRVRAF